MQLDLFADAPRYYYLAIDCLARLDLAGCVAALEKHRRSSPGRPDPRPVEQAAEWLGRRIPQDGDDAVSFGREGLELCRCLREARAAPAFGRLGPGTAGRVARAVAVRCVARMAEANVDPSDALTESLPWGAFLLWTGDLVRARDCLEAFLRTRRASCLAYLALGDVLWELGRSGEALCAYREGYGLDPAGERWEPVCPRVKEMRRLAARESEHPGEWWAVEAYLEGQLPAYSGAPAEEVNHRRLRFDRLREEAAGGARGAIAPALFFCGLFLSEQADRLEAKELVRVRQTLRELHPDLYEVHMERLGGGRRREDRVGGSPA